MQFLRGPWPNIEMHALYTTLLDAHCILQFATCNAHATSKRAGKTKRGLQTLLARFFATPSLHHSVHFINAPIFRLLLKVAVKGTHQCDFLNFWGGSTTPNLALHTLRPITLTLKPAPCNFHLSPWTLHFAPLHLAPCALRLARCALRP